MSAASTDLVPVWSDWTRPAAKRTTSAIGAALAAGIATDIALRNGPPTISGAALVAITAAGVLVAGRLENKQAITLAALAPLFGGWLAVRTSVWLLPLDILAAAGLLALAASYARGGSILDLSVPGAIVHGMRAVANAILAPAYLFGGASVTGRRAAVVRGFLLALPLAIVVGALLASADAVFASALRFDWGDLVFHAFAIVIGAWGMAALLRLAAVEPPKDVTLFGSRLGRTEWTIVLGSLDLLLGAFAVARLVALTEGGRRVISTSGLTYAEYARSGFFQLLAASIIAFAALLVLRPLVEPRDRRRFVVLAEIALGLLLLVVVQAIQRLALYERAFGLTMPRLVATTACIGLGLVLCAAGLWFLGVGGARHWFWAAAGAVSLAALFTLNAMNAEALVVERNAARAERTGTFDTGELAELGDDAVPALEAALPGLPADARREARAWLCGSYDPDPGSLFAYNGGRDGAIEARNRVCSGGS